ncbi:MAG: hypothetical protein PHW50_02075 [Patescibacteria group bacterium]|nr:hypothetical protein [Patescibacteria group bacterium]
MPEQFSEGELIKPIDESRPSYERRSTIYPAGHLIRRILYRHKPELESGVSLGQLRQDQIDAMLLNAMALADEYLVSPQNKLASEQKRTRVEEYDTFKDKHGDQLADTFLSQLDEEKQAFSEEAELTEVDQKIETDIVEIFSHPQVRQEFSRVFDQERFLRKSARTKITNLIALENAIDSARARYRQIQNEPKNLDPQSAALPTGMISSNLGKYLEIIGTLKLRVTRQEAGLNYQQLGLLESQRLLKTKSQMRDYGFAMTESRQMLFDRISELTSAGYKIFLGGPTGTGKTSLAVFAMRQILGQENRFEVVSWSSETTIRDLFGKPIIKTNPEGGIESTMQKGPYARVLSGETRGIINDEYTSGQTASQLSLKRIYQAHAGEPINLPGFNGQVFTKENFLEISTGNLRSKQHQQREEMDPAIAREFVSIDVPFLDSEEAKMILLSSFIHEIGYIPLSRVNVEMIDQLCRAAEFTQKAFEDRFSPEQRQSDLYRQIEPSGAEIHLTKTFFDSGTLFRLVKGVSGRTFAEHLRMNLDREINENPHLKALPQEREVFVKILRVFGFDLTAQDETNFFRPIASDNIRGADASRPYILPSELGFLSNVEHIDIDEFAEPTEPEISDSRSRVESELTELMGSPDIPEAIKEVLAPKETMLSAEIAEAMREAKEIMNKDGETRFFGPEEVKAALNIEEEIVIPEIPFTKAELERARELNQILILRLSMSIKQVNEQLSGKLKDGQKLLYRFDPSTGKLEEDCWYEDESFYKTEQARGGWALVSRELVPETTSKNYLEQTQSLVDYLTNQVFSGATLPSEYQESINEFLAQKGTIEGLISSDWKRAGEMLASLRINNLTRQTPAEALYDLAVYCQTTDQRLLGDKYTWTNGRGSDGRLVGVGGFGSGGVVVTDARPGYSRDALGVSFSRSR